MQALLTAHRPVRLCTQPTKPFKVIVAYDGIEAGQHAMKVYSHLIHEIDIDLQFQNTLVSFDLLANSRFAEQASETASEADMLIVAASEAVLPPPAVRHWIEKWLLTRTPGVGALVGILRTRPDETPPKLLLHDYLANAAEQSGIPYFQGAIPASPEPMLPFQGTPDREQITTSPLNHLLGHVVEHSMWGINE